MSFDGPGSQSLRAHALPRNAIRIAAIADVERAQPHAMERYGRAFLVVHRQAATKNEETGLVSRADARAIAADDVADNEMFAIPLQQRSGAGAGRASGVVTIGRLEHNDLFFGDDSVSKLHAIVREENGVYTIADAGSLLGTFVDGEPVGRMLDGGARVLHGGETVQLGNVTAMFVDAEGLLVVAGAL